MEVTHLRVLRNRMPGGPLMSCRGPQRLCRLASVDLQTTENITQFADYSVLGSVS